MLAQSIASLALALIPNPTIEPRPLDPGATGTPSGSCGARWRARGLPGHLYAVTSFGAKIVEIGAHGDVVRYLAPFLTGPMGCLARGPRGALYAVDLPRKRLYRYDAHTGRDRFVGGLGVRNSLFEGGLAIADDGRAWFMNMTGSGLNPRLLSLDLHTGAATPVGPLGGNYDINGLAWRSDDRLVGLDRVRNALVLIDPITASTSTLANVSPQVGATGGLAIHEGMGYFATGGVLSGGTHELWSFDPFSGAATFVMALPQVFRDWGISGMTFGVGGRAAASATVPKATR